LGRERLVSPLDWSNTRRVFQGLQARAAARGAEVTAFWVRPVTIRRRLPNVADTMKQLYGAQLAWRRPGKVAEAYWLRFQSGSASFNGTAGIERRHTI